MTAGGMEHVTGYSDLETVGEGGFGIVYRARQEHLGRTVALKVLPCDTLDDRALHKFRQECQLVGQLTGHPNVVTVLETGTAQSGWPYIAMEYYERGSLRDRLAREGPLAMSEVLDIGCKIAGALAAAHDAGIVHRDVKPQNILMSRFGEPALSDFGIATLLDGADFSIHDDAFTPHHAAPEVLEGQPPSPASDVYSLGSTLYQLLTGKPAPRPEGGSRVAAQEPGIASEEPAAPAGVPAPVMEVIQRAMARRPEDRFGSAFSFAEHLQHLQRELGLPVTEVATAQRDQPASDALNPALTSFAQERTVAGPRTQPRPAGETKARRVWRPGRAAAIAAAGITAAGLVVALGLGAFMVLSQAQARRAVSGSPAAQASQLPISPNVVSAAQPLQLTAVDGGTAAVLHWQLQAGGPQYPLVVEQVQSGREAATLNFLDRGSMTATVSDLDPRRGYCFRVGALVATGSPATISWSQPVCIRGAVPEPAPTAT